MPVRIPRGRENVVIDLVVVHAPGVVGQRAVSFRVREVQRHARLGTDLAHRARARLHQRLYAEPFLFAAEIIVRLVAYLHYVYLSARVQQLKQAFARVFVQRFSLRVGLHALPRLGHHLLGRVRPEIGIVKTRYQLKPVRGGASAYLARGVYVAVAAAVAGAVFAIGIVPYAHADMRDAVFGKQREYVGLAAVKAVIPDAAVFLGEHA